MIPAPTRICTGIGRHPHRRVGRERLPIGPEQTGLLAGVECGSARQTSRRAASTSIAMSASLNDTACFGPGLAECMPLRARSRSKLEGGRATPSERRQPGDGSHEEVDRELEVLARPPRMRSAGRRASRGGRAGKRRAQAELCSFGPAETPGRAFQEERSDLVVELREHHGQVGDPAVRHVAILAGEEESSPSRRALDWIAPKSEPAAGSVKAMAASAAVLGGEARAGSAPAAPSLPGRKPAGGPGTSSPRSAPRGPRSPTRAPRRSGDDVTAATPPPPYSTGNRVRGQTRAPPPCRAVQRGQSSRSSHSARDRPQLPLGEVVREVAELALLRRQVERDPGGCYPRHRGSTPKLVVARGRRTARPRTGTARPGAA